jgi:outer membrane lipopolysaccharide assembly protein LptE/RlpB
MPKFSLAVILVVIAAGCGYNLQATGQPAGMAISSLSIPMMTSPSSALGFEADFTRVIRREFVSHSQIPLVSSDAAGMVLTGVINKISTEPLSYSVGENKFEVTTSRWLRIRLDAKLVDRKSGNIVWHDPNMEEKVAFSVNSDPMITAYNERKAAEAAAKLFAERIYMKTMERF